MDETQTEGDIASFICQADGDPLPTISWYFNDAPLDESNTAKYTITERQISTTTNTDILNIMSVQSSDVGTYTCNATNVVSSDTSSGILTVNGESKNCFLATFNTLLMQMFDRYTLVEQSSYVYRSTYSNRTVNIF